MIHVSLGFSMKSNSFLRFPAIILCALLFSPLRATCSAHLILLGSLVRVMFGEEWNSWRQFCSFHQLSIAFSLACSGNLLRTLFSNTPSLCSSLFVTEFRRRNNRESDTSLVFQSVRFEVAEDKKYSLAGSKYSLIVFCSSVSFWMKKLYVRGLPK
jgi:hypothetical protein